MERLRRFDRATVIAIGAVAAYSWVAAGFRPFTTTEEVLVAVPALVALVAAARPSGGEPGERRHPSRGSAVVWIGLAAVGLGLQLRAYFSSPRADHPTLSAIANDVMSERPGRALVFALWLGLGWVLVRRPWMVRR